jgi:small basic protein (TIGR04137 family)
MSIHNSYVTKGGFTKHRNVFTRAERIEKLKEASRWKGDDKESIFNLPKIRSIKMT